MNIETFKRAEEIQLDLRTINEISNFNEIDDISILTNNRCMVLSDTLQKDIIRFLKEYEKSYNKSSTIFKNQLIQLRKDIISYLT